MENLYDIKIEDRQSFIRFLKLLLFDYRTNKDEWENQDIASFLEAMSRYAEDIEGYYKFIEKDRGEKIDADVASWRVFADILRGAKVYE